MRKMRLNLSESHCQRIKGKLWVKLLFFLYKIILVTILINFIIFPLDEVPSTIMLGSREWRTQRNTKNVHIFVQSWSLPTEWEDACNIFSNFPSQSVGQTVEVPLRTYYWTFGVSTPMKALTSWPDHRVFVLSGSHYFTPEVIHHLYNWESK